MIQSSRCESLHTPTCLVECGLLTIRALLPTGRAAVVGSAAGGAGGSLQRRCAASASAVNVVSVLCGHSVYFSSAGAL